MIAEQKFYDICFMVFYPTALATVYGQRPKFVRAEHLATAEGEKCGYGPTLKTLDNLKFKNKPRHLRLSLPLRFSLGILQLSKKMPSKNQHHRRPRKTIPTASSLCTHSCPRGSITSSSHVFTNPESMKPEFFP